MISVILPVYQVEAYIEKCLQTLIAQTYRDIEIICVDDCTLDNSITIIKEYQKKDPRIRLIHHEENRGLGGARNTGIDHARGEYLVFIDSDDYADETMMEKLYEAITQNRCDAAVCGIMLVFEEDHTMKQHSTFHYDHLIPQEVCNLEQNRKILTDMWPSACNKLFLASIVRDGNLRFKERILYEDHTFFYEYFSMCKNFCYIQEPLYFYRKARPNSITTHSVGREQEIFTVLEYLSGIFADLYQEDSEELFAKIAIRLLYERRWIFQNGDENYYLYLDSASNYLSQWDIDFLRNVKDTFIEDSDPIFLSADEIKKARKAERKKSRWLKGRIRQSIKKVPVIKQFVNLKSSVVTYRNDFYWYTTNIFDTLHKLYDKSDHVFSDTEASQQIGELNKNISYLLSVLSETEIKSRFEGMSEKVVSDMEAGLNASKKKIDDIWWLSWNIKDCVDAGARQEADSESGMLRYYPTWIPCEYPAYFKGNIWYWADRFKEYYISDRSKCQLLLENLVSGMCSENAAYVKLLWERNVRLLPYAEYSKEEVFLIKTDYLFTEEERKAQKEIARSFSEQTSKYFLPEGIVYEIPVFYFEHGLKTLSEAALKFVKEGDILDLGGYIGDSALILSNYTDKIVYTVEINASNIDTMKMVLRKNKKENKVCMIHCGVGNADTEKIFYGDSSYSTFYPMKANELYVRQDAVPVLKTDTLVMKYHMVPHFIKMDVEGMEYAVIEGAKETICRYRPVLSISIYHTPKDFLEIKPLLESWNLNYKFYIENHNPFDPVYEKMLICIPGEL